MSRARLVCLLPVRNGAEDLPGWFDSVRVFADAVVALDDGSTDDTAEMLMAEPLVEIILRNPRRETFAGWDDSANRNRLLQAAHALNPDWIMSLDADERIDSADGQALRRFIDRDALPKLAYSMRVFRMEGDTGQLYDPKGMWVCRLFSFDPGQKFPANRLHFVPVPVSIPRRCWVRTTLRIQHFGAQSAERRRSRYEKYREADPNNEFQEYDHLLLPPTEVRNWETRPDDSPVLVQPASVKNVEPTDLDSPVLSAIVIAQNDEATIERSLSALVTQEMDVPFEVIVVTSGSDRTAAIVRDKFPSITLIELPRPVLPGEARNAGWRIARGDYLTFPGSHIEVCPGNLSARLAAHEAGWAMVTSTVLNGNQTPAGWASYFLDHSSTLPGRPSGELPTAPGHCSYQREILEELGGFPSDRRAGEDTVVNLEAFRRGYTAYREGGAAIIHASPCVTSWQLIRHHFQRGRALGKILVEKHRPQGQLLWHNRHMLVTIYARRVAGIRTNVDCWGKELEPTYRQVRRRIVLGAAAAAFGTYFELLYPGRGKWSVLFGTGLLRKDVEQERIAFGSRASVKTATDDL